MFGYDDVDAEAEFEDEVDPDAEKWALILEAYSTAVETHEWSGLYEKINAHRAQFSETHSFFDILTEKLHLAKTGADFEFIRRLSLAEQMLNYHSAFPKILQAMDYFDRGNLSMVSTLFKGHELDIGGELGRMSIQYKDNPIVAKKLLGLLYFLAIPTDFGQKKRSRPIQV